MASYELLGDHLSNMRKIDLEEFGEGLAVIGAVQHAVDIVENLDLGRPRIVGGRAEIVLRSGHVRRVDSGRLADLGVKLGFEV